ncbi:hypothetical protein AN958_04529 [Leucoagaricus sp. SymC.cos]|nr:hypothetical protein AN958_04529 [Leucoagaricus sp. SymC.cos]
MCQFTGYPGYLTLFALISRRTLMTHVYAGYPYAFLRKPVIPARDVALHGTWAVVRRDVNRTYVF